MPDRRSVPAILVLPRAESPAASEEYEGRARLAERAVDPAAFGYFHQSCPPLANTPRSRSAGFWFDKPNPPFDIAPVFRPCIDLHEGKVKQIVGGSFRDDPAQVQTNFVSERPAAWYAELYQRDGLKGGHVIMLGPGNEAAARSALAAFPGGLQIGGGINLDNAPGWLEAGASHVVVTSYVFREGALDWERLRLLVQAVGKTRLVLDLSCRRRGSDYFVVTDRWQKFTTLALSGETLSQLAAFCAEFLIHAVDVEGLGRGIDIELVEKLAQWTPIPATYAGGAMSLADLERVTRVGQGRIDLTIGSALDLFGGTGVRYQDAVAFNQRQRRAEQKKG